MSKQQNDGNPPRFGNREHERSLQRIIGRLAALCFAVFVLNLLSGKISTVLGAEQPLRLPDIPELLLLLASVILFVCTTLLAERREQQQQACATDANSTTPEGA